MVRNDREEVLQMATVSDAGQQLGTIETNIPARLDRLPWSRWDWRILVGAGS
jgi:hypothetical protein